jgi:radical S-adenosyl methionine domain-containing protein 2
MFVLKGLVAREELVPSQHFGIKFKVNTVIYSLNWDKNMTHPITQFQPFRWKVFQCLIVTGENDNKQRKHNACSFLISDEQWKTFCDSTST